MNDTQLPTGVTDMDINTNSDAYNDGFESFAQGDSRNSPYEPRSWEWANWIAGYDAAAN
jgi:hypothetical protein